MKGSSVVKYFPQRNLDDGNRFKLTTYYVTKLHVAFILIRITTGISDKIE